MRTALLVSLVAASACSLIWFASTKWERSLGAVRYSRVSPEGCFRLDSVVPYWILPKLLHPYVHDGRLVALTLWDPIFYRLYDNRTGELLDQTRIYNSELGNGSISWDSGSVNGPRQIAVGVMLISLHGRCSSPTERNIIRRFEHHPLVSSD